MSVLPAPAADTDQRQDNGKGKTEYSDRGEGAVSGNLTRDPELRYSNGGKAIAVMRVAETLRQQNKRTGQWEDGETVFHDVTVWGDQAEHCVDALVKGDRVAAVGRWQARAWTDAQGARQERVALVARDVGPSLAFRSVTVHRSEGGQ